MLISNRANTILLVAILAVGIALITMQASGARGGPLDPPAAPGSTDGVRKAGTPIDHVPFTITTPGYYYFTKNLSAGAGNGVNVNASRVTVDFGGFTLDGTGPTGVGGTSFLDSVTVEHGVVTGFTYGIELYETSEVHVTDMQVLGGSGEAIGAGPKSLVDTCVVANSNGDGIHVDAESVVRDCHVSEVAGFGVRGENRSVIENNVVLNAGANGINYAIWVTAADITVRNNTVEQGNTRGIGVQGNAAVIIDNAIHCAASIVNLGGTYYAPVGTEQHANVPRYAVGYGGC